MKIAPQEVGDRVAREIEMENTGSKSRRVWWIKSAALTMLLNQQTHA